MAELVPTSPTEYRKGKTKLLRLSSGAVFEIRKMPITALSDMLGTLGLDVPPGTPLESIDEIMKEKMNDPSMKTKTVEVIVRLLPRCVVAPKIGAGSEELSIDDISPGDIFELFSEIMDFSGISQIAEDMREKFRDQSSR